MLGLIRSLYYPNRTVMIRPPDGTSPDVTSLAPFTKDMVMTDGKATAYVCSGRTCQSPTNNPNELLRTLGGGSNVPRP